MHDTIQSAIQFAFTLLERVPLLTMDCFAYGKHVFGMTGTSRGDLFC